MLREHAFNAEFDAQIVVLSFAAAQGRARALRRRLRASAADQEDFRQEILLDLVARAERFDAARGSWPAFVCVVTRHAAAQIEKKQSRVAAFVRLLPQEGGAADFGQRARAVDLAIDLKRAIERLPSHLQRLVGVIAEAGNLARAQRASALSPASFYRALRELRLRLLAAGLIETVSVASLPPAWRRRGTIRRTGE